MLYMILVLMMKWKGVFKQDRTVLRAMRQGIGLLCVAGRRTIARSLVVRGQTRRDWSGEYQLHRRSEWEGQRIFEPLVREALEQHGGQRVTVALDDTRLRKTGKKIATAQWGRDPLSPPFQVNLQYGLRFLHAAVILPLYEAAAVTARAIPVWFEEVAPVRKPGKTATAVDWAAYREAVKQRNLSQAAVELLRGLRARFDTCGGKDKLLVGVVDGSFCNRTVWRAALERTELVGRVRKDAVLCQPGTGRRKYAKETFTPEALRTDDTIPWQEARIFHGGAWRLVAYKEVNRILWRRGAGQRLLRVFVVRPIPYRKTKAGKLLYREPAFLLTTDGAAPAAALLQAYFDRLQIEVAHRELKDTCGVGQAQVRSPKSVARQPAFAAALYSALLLAGLKTFGPTRSPQLGPLPKWQREKTRASCQDFLNYLRLEVVRKPELTWLYGLEITPESILAAAGT